MTDIGKEEQNKKDIDNILSYLSTVCPVNNNSQVVMLKRTFEKMCKKVREKRKGALQNNGFCVKVRANYNPCNKCQIFKSIKEGKEYVPPTGMTFSNFESILEN